MEFAISDKRVRIRFGRGRSPQGPGLLGLSEDGIRLGARLRASLTDSDRTLLFTGTAEGDGVTTVATLVARALARMNEGEILLVDGNLRRPRLHEIFEARPVPGLLDVLAGTAPLEASVRPSEIPSLSYLPAGNTDPDPVSLLTSTGFAKLMLDLRGLFRFILVDSSPLLQFADTALIAPHIDGVVVVVAAGRRRRGAVREVTQVVGGLRAKLIGVVLSERSPRRFWPRPRTAR